MEITNRIFIFWKKTFDLSLSQILLLIWLIKKFGIFQGWIKDTIFTDTHIPGTPVFTHYTSTRRRYATHDVAMKNKNKI